jgi:hypothetical protein
MRARRTCIPAFATALVAAATCTIAQVSVAPVKTAETASAPAKAIVDARAALDATPRDCDAIAHAFTSLSQSGRQPGDIEVIVLARRTELPCAVSAADQAATTLAIPQAEVVSWVLAHPAPPEDALPLDPADEPGIALECGLRFIDRRIATSPQGARLILTFRNISGRTISGHDIVMKINGQPWRSQVLPHGEEAGEPILGAADQLQWDTQGGSWTDKRLIETQAVTFPSKKEAQPMRGPVSPGGTFDVIARAEGLTAETKPADVDVTFDSCVLK